jgi:hypothetical protein
MNTLSRRQFMKNSAILTGVSIGASRVLGANDRLSIGVIGCSERARSALMKQVVGLGKTLNVELTAVCDLWSVNREKGAKLVTDNGGKAPRQFKYMDEMLALKDLDGVIVATGDFQHAPLLKVVVEAGKDCYCEKPMAIDIETAKAAYKTVLLSDRIVQMGTQGISRPASQGARKTIAAGVLGTVSMVDAHQSYWGPRWRYRSEPALLQEKDTDWKAWLLDRPFRPFDPHLYFEYRIYRGFGLGIAGQWMAHIAAEQAHIMNVTFPKSVFCKDNTLVWKDGRQFGDTFQAIVTYDNYVYVHRCTFGNNYPGYVRFYGKNGTMESSAGGYQVSGVGGGDAATAENLAHEKASIAKGEGYRCNPDKIQKEFTVDTSEGLEGEEGHMRNWLECIRSRQQPNAPIVTGYAHSVICTMCDRSDQLGREVYWDMEKQEIVDSPVAP